MLLAVFKEINFIAFFRQKIWDRKVDKNDLSFNKQYIKKTFKKKQIKKCNKYFNQIKLLNKSII